MFITCYNCYLHASHMQTLQAFLSLLLALTRNSDACQICSVYLLKEKNLKYQYISYTNVHVFFNTKHQSLQSYINHRFVPCQ